MTLSFLNPFYEAVAWVLIHIHAVLGGVFGPDSGAAWALSIILLTCLMRLIVVPLFIKQMKSQRKMMALQPQVNALKKKYKNDKQTLNQELMKLYQENGANPLMGCLPLIVQLPVFWALFDVLEAVSRGQAKYGFTPALVYSALHAKIFGATIADRIAQSPLPPFHFTHEPPGVWAVIIVTVAISAVTTFLTMSQSIKRGMGQMMTDPDNPMASSQKYMKYVGPIFALSGLYWQFGLVMYWVTSNVWTLAQTSIIYRKFMPVTAGAGAAGAASPDAKAAPAAAPGFTKGAVSAQKGPAARGTAADGAVAKGAVSKSTAAKTVAPKVQGRPASASTPGKPAPEAPKPATAGGRAPAASGTKPPSPGRPAGARTAATAGSGQGAGGAQRAQRPQKPGTAPGSGADASRRPAPGGKRGSAAANGAAANGSEKRGLSRLIRGKPEPEPEPEAAAPRLVRQQRVRQPRSKRSGKR